MQASKVMAQASHRPDSAELCNFDPEAKPWQHCQQVKWVESHASCDVLCPSTYQVAEFTRLSESLQFLRCDDIAGEPHFAKR
jgi:hypothetical protein